MKPIKNKKTNEFVDALHSAGRLGFRTRITGRFRVDILEWKNRLPTGSGFLQRRRTYRHWRGRLLAAQRGQHDKALSDLKEALQHGSTSFLAYYVYAQEKYRLTADAQNRYSPLTGSNAPTSAAR